MINRGQILQVSFVVALLATAGSASAQPTDSIPGNAAEASSASAVKSAKAPRSADRKLAHRVATALGRTRGLNPTRIIVRARDGHVTLSGSVPDDGQIPLAVDAAQQVEGVKTVQQVLHISEQPL
jgi:hyperosmotically inducible protein